MHVDPKEVRRLRERRGWHQKDLARAAGLSKPYISQLESGTRVPSPMVAAALARALEVPVDKLAPLKATCPNCGHQFTVD